jgi:hypothetical protein
MTIEITREIAAKVLEVVDAGLVHGIGNPMPGQMCVEAAVCFALGLSHGDEPSCVLPALRSLKIRLNDSSWSSDQERAKGLRRLALAQLGSDGVDESEFHRRIIDNALGSTVSRALRIAASVQKDQEHKQALIDAAARCERERSRESALDARTTARAATYTYASAYAADAAAYAYAAASAANAASASASAASAANAAAASAANAANAAYAERKSAHDKSLSDYAEEIVQIMISMNAPGCQWLDLAPLDAA